MSDDDKSSNQPQKTEAEKAATTAKNWEGLKKALGRTPSVLQVHSLIKDLDDIAKFNDEKIVEKIEKLLNLNDSKVLNVVKNSKAGEDELTMLHMAAKHYRHVPIQMLIDELEIDPNIVSKSQKTALHILVKTEKIYEKKMGVFEEKFVKSFEALVSRNANVNAVDDHKMSVLQYAVIANNLKAVELLLKQPNIDIYNVDSHQMTALHYSIKLGHDKISSLLIDCYEVEPLLELEKITSKNTTSLPIHTAVSSKNEKLDIVVQLLEKVKKAESNYLLNLMFYRLNEFKQSILQIAINRGHLNIIEAILKDYYIEFDKLDGNGNLPIHMAAYTGNVNILDVLIKLKLVRCSPNSKNETPLHIAAQKNRFAFIAKFLKYDKEHHDEMNEPEDNNDYIPCIQRLNNNGYPPLFSALLMDHLPSVKVLAQDPDIDYTFQDKNGDTAFHICAQFNNSESLRYMLKNPNFIDNTFLLNKNEETPLHLAGKFGNIEIFKIILAKFYDGTLDGKDQYLSSRDKNGRTCFHLTCIAGYHNIVYYLTKDLKLQFLTELVDNADNTALHFASMNGHLSVVEVLVDSDEPELDARNSEHATALELSCRKRFFDISKVLINSIKHHDEVPFQNRDGFHLLHLAAQEGAHEVVELLLEKGAPINSLNDNKENALDIAIVNEQPLVIKVLLENPEWQLLIDHSRRSPKKKESFYAKSLRRLSTKPKTTKIENIQDGYEFYDGENPQLYALWEHEMWEEWVQVLNNSHDVETETFDFRVLDPPNESMNKHPLMLIARSGQETMLTHETTTTLLNLKWRYIPRILFYTNIALYIALLVIYSLYINELTNHVIENSEKDEHKFDGYYSQFHVPIIVLLGLNILKIVIQVLFSDGISYFVNVIHWIEIIAIIFGYLSIFIYYLNSRTQFAAVGVLAIFFTFVFLIQKIYGIGIYVIAFQRTLVNSSKFLPVFFIVYIGYWLAFRVLVNENVTAFNTTTSTAFVTGITVILGEFNGGSGFGLEDSALNYILYFSFIAIMGIIVLNLFVGIAVGDMNRTLEEADIKQISLRIVYVMKVQDALKYFKRVPVFNKLFNMQHTVFSYETDETKVIKFAYSFLRFLRTRLIKTPSINLVNPQKRLEEMVSHLSSHTANNYKAIKEAMDNQVIEVNNKLANSQQRLEDILLESSRNTRSNFESSADDSASALGSVEEHLKGSQKVIAQQVVQILNILETKFAQTRSSFASRLHNSDKLNRSNFETIMAKLKAILELDITELNERTNNMRETNVKEFFFVKSLLAVVDQTMQNLQKDVNGLSAKVDSNQAQLIQTDLKVDFIETVVRKESFKDLSSLRQQTSRFSPDYDRIKVIEDSVKTIDERLIKSAEDSTKLKTTFKKLENLTEKARQLDEEISRIHVLDESVDAADVKLDKAIQETRKLDETISKLDGINQRMDKIEPELSKINAIELTLNKFDEQQTLLIGLVKSLLDRKPPKFPQAPPQLPPLQDIPIKEEIQIHEEIPIQAEPTYSTLIDDHESQEGGDNSDRKLSYKVQHL